MTHTVKVGQLDDVLALVPQFLGFNPESSLVVLGVKGNQFHVTFRYDLPDPPDDDFAADIAAHAVQVLAERRIGWAMLVGYGPDALVTPLMNVMQEAMTVAGIIPLEVLRVEDDRYWSYQCHDEACHPAAGTPYSLQGNSVTAGMEAAGRSPEASRVALAATLAAPEGDAAKRAASARRRAERRLDGMLLPDVLLEGRQAVVSYLEVAAAGQTLTDDQVAWLCMLLGHLPVRDDAWARMDPKLRREHMAFWSDVVHRVDPALIAAPGSLLAFTAWQCGEGAIANIILERMLKVDPAYPMAELIGAAVQAGLGPEHAIPPMTPDEVAASYAALQGS